MARSVTGVHECYRVTNCFVVGFKACSTGGNTCLTLQSKTLWPGSLQALGESLLWLFLSVDTESNCPWNSHLHTHTLVRLSGFTTEVCVCRRWQLAQKLTTVNETVTSYPPTARRPWQNRRQKNLKKEENQSKTASSGHNRTTALMSSEQRWLPAQGQPSRHPTWTGETHEPSP